MSHAERFTGSYDITGLDTDSNVNVTAHTLVVNGNLRVVGTVASVSTTNTTVTDNVITLNQGETGAGVTAVYSGIEVDRGLLNTVALRWNEALDIWELTSDGITYSQIAVGGGVLSNVVEDTTPQLGGDLDVLGHSIYSSTTETVPFDVNLMVKYTTVAPSVVMGYNVVYAKTPAGGGSGLYVTNTTYQNQELVTKTKAIVYALIM